MKMKYVLFETPSGLNHVFMFDCVFEHVNMANMMNKSYPGIKPISAGFISISEKEIEDDVCVYGESQSLHLNAKKEDEILIKHMIKNN